MNATLLNAKGYYAYAQLTLFSLRTLEPNIGMSFSLQRDVQILITLYAIFLGIKSVYFRTPLRPVRGRALPGLHYTYPKDN